MAAPPPNADWRSTHLWQIQPVRDALLIAAGIGLVYLGYKLSVVTVPLLLALLLAYLFEPLVRRATRAGRLPRTFVAGTIIGVSAFIILVPATVGIGIATGQGVRFTQRLARSADTFSRAIQHPDDPASRPSVEPLGRTWLGLYDFALEERRKNAPANTEAGPDAAPSETSDTYRLVQWGVTQLRDNAGEIAKRLLNFGGGAIGATLGFFASVGGILFGMFLTAFFFFFMCTGYGRVLKFWESLIPERKKGRVVDLVSKMDDVIAGFVRGRLTICGILIVFHTLAYWIIGVPAWLLLGPVVGVLTIVPYASGLVGIPAAVILLWLGAPDGFRGEWWWVLGAPLAVTGLSQFLDDYLLTPKIQGDSTKLDTPTILFASIAGGSLAGFYGILIAIPVAACIRILLVEVFWPRFRDWSQGRAKDMLPLGKD